MGGGRPDAGPLPFDLPGLPTELCSSNSGFLGDGEKRAGQLTAAAARFAEHPALAIRNLSGLFRIMPQLAAVLYQVSGIIDFRRGRRNRCRRGLVMPRWQ